MITDRWTQAGSEAQDRGMERPAGGGACPLWGHYCASYR